MFEIVANRVGLSKKDNLYSSLSVRYKPTLERWRIGSKLVDFENIVVLTYLRST